MDTAATSRQVVFTGPGRVEIMDAQVPSPAAEEIVLRVQRVGICATDLHLLAGEIGDPFPLVPGHEFVGEVWSQGADAAAARGLDVGERVVAEMLIPCGRCPRCREGRYNLCDGDDMATGLTRGRQYGVNIPRTVSPGLWGGYSQFLTVPSSAIVHRLGALPWDRAVLVEPLAVAFRAVARARVSPGESVVVVGPGPVGLLASAAARSAGAGAVTLVGTRRNRLMHGPDFGADETIAVTDEVAVPQQLRDKTGSLADVVIELAGRPAAQEQSVGLVRRGGRVVLAGACGADVPVTFRADEDLLTREIDVLPSFLSAGGFEPAIRLLTRGGFPFDALVTHRFGLEDVTTAFETVRARAEGALKVVLDPWLEVDGR